MPVSLNAAVAVLGQCVRIAFSGHDGADDRLAGQAHDVGEHLGELNVHLHQRLLHPLYPTGLLGEQHLALTGHRAHDTHVTFWAPSGTQESQAHQLLQPLAILYVALTARNVLHLTRVHQPNLQATLFEYLIHRDPIDASGLEGHRVDTTGEQPVGHGVQVVGHRTELAYRVFRRIPWHRHPVT